MRLDLMRGGSRPWLLRMGLRMARWRLGLVPGPIQVATYQPSLNPISLARYMLRGLAGLGRFSRSESELMAAFVSNLNACHF